MSRAPRCRRVTALLVALFVSRPACADVRLVLASDRDATLTRRLTAEASEIGLVLVPAKLRADEAPRRLSEREHAAGVLHVVSAERVELWVPLPNSGLARFETARGRTESDEAFAIRIVEEVRARFVELHVPEAEKLAERSKSGAAGDAAVNAASAAAPPLATSSAPAAKPPTADDGGSSSSVADEARARGRPSPRSIGLGVTGGAGGTFVSGGLGGAATAMVGAYLRAGAPFRITAQAFLPLTSGGASGSEGTANVRAYFFTLNASYVPWPTDSSSSPWAAFGAGVGGALLTLDGRAAPGYVGKDDELGAAVPFVNVVLAQNLGASLAVEATLLAGVSVPRPTVRFEGREVAAWGRAVTAAVVAIDWTLPMGGPVKGN